MTRTKWLLALLALSGGAVSCGATDASDEQQREEAPAVVRQALASAHTVRSASAGAFHSCAVLDDGKVKCWGGNASGQLGYGDVTQRGDQSGEMGGSLPVVDLGTGYTANAVALGETHSCALLDNGWVRCWGGNAYGQLGQNTTVAKGDNPGEMGDALPIVLFGANPVAKALAVGGFHTCAVLADDSARCWGRNTNGQLGVDSTTTRGDGPGEIENLAAVPLARPVRRLAAGLTHTCAQLDDNSVRCWGGNAYGQLGYDDFVQRDTPGEMAALPTVNLGAGRTARSIAAGANHTCAILDDFRLKCWGRNDYGQLGIGASDHRGDGAGEMSNLPAVALGTNRTARAVTAGEFHTCALLDDATVKCWGRSNAGQTGGGSTATRGDGPGEMGALGAVALGAQRTTLDIGSTSNHTCALLDTRELKCWGGNASGELGLENLNHRGDAPAEMGDSLGRVDLGPRAAASDPKGVFEQASVNFLTGWACDQDAPDQAVDVHFWATDVKGGTNSDGTPCPEASGQWCFVGAADSRTAVEPPALYKATLWRESAVAVQCNDGGRHGFKVPTPGILLDGKVHSISATALNVGAGTSKLLGSVQFDSNVLYRQESVRNIDRHLLVLYGNAPTAPQFFVHAPEQNGLFLVDHLLIAAYGQLVRPDGQPLLPSASVFRDPPYGLRDLTGSRSATGSLVPAPDATWQRGLHFANGITGYQAYGTTMGAVLAPALKIAASNIAGGGWNDGAIFSLNWRRPQPVFFRSEGDKIRIEGYITHPYSSNPGSAGKLFFYWTLAFEDRSHCWTTATGSSECQKLWYVFRIYQDRFDTAWSGLSPNEGFEVDYLATPLHPTGLVDSILAPGSVRARPCNGSRYFYGPNLAQASSYLQLPSTTEATRAAESYYCVEISGANFENGLAALNAGIPGRNQTEFAPRVCAPDGTTGGVYCENVKRQLECQDPTKACLPQIQQMGPISTNALDYALTHFNLNLEAWASNGGSDPRIGMSFRDTKITQVRDATNNVPYGYLGIAGNVVSGWTCDFDAWWRPLDVHFYATGVSSCSPADQGVLGGEAVCYLGGVTADDYRPDAAPPCNGNENTGFSFSIPVARLNPAIPTHKIYAIPLNYPGGANVSLYNGSHVRGPVIYP